MSASGAAALRASLFVSLIVSTASIVRLEGAARAEAERRALEGVIGREKNDAARFAHLLEKAPLISSLVVDPPGATPAEAELPLPEPPVLNPAWASDLKLPPYVLDTLPPVSMDAVRLHPASPSARAPVLPTLFMPGFPKSATSWLYGCLLHAFNPEAVGCGKRAAGWNAVGEKQCNRRFALTALYTGASGRAASWKEIFFFGGRGPDRQYIYNRDLLELHGPDPTVGPLAQCEPREAFEPHTHTPPHIRMPRRCVVWARELEHGTSSPPPFMAVPPLWPWEDQLHPHESYLSYLQSLSTAQRSAMILGGQASRMHMKAHMDRLHTMCSTATQPQSCNVDNFTQACGSARPRCSVLGTAACEKPNWTGQCRGMGAMKPQPANGCAHPACVRVAAASAGYAGQFTSCGWAPHLQSISGRSEAFCAHSMLPWAREGARHPAPINCSSCRQRRTRRRPCQRGHHAKLSAVTHSPPPPLVQLLHAKL